MTKELFNIYLILTRGGVAVTRWAHNPKIVGSNPTLAIFSMVSKLKYDFFEHTADIGVIVKGKTIEEIIENLVLVFSDLTTDISKLEKSIEEKISLEFEDFEEMIIKTMEEIIFLFETKKFLTAECSVNIKNKAILCEMKGDIFDSSIYPSKFIIKAITYHQFELRKEKDKWILRVVFDV